MVRYVAQTPYFLFIRLLLAMSLSLSLPVLWDGGLAGAEAEQEVYELERYERKIVPPIRTVSKSSLPAAPLKSTCAISPSYKPAERLLPALGISFSPIIYLLMKRRWLSPLKFTSNYVINAKDSTKTNKEMTMNWRPDFHEL